jgi:hypothetical protein
MIRTALSVLALLMALRCPTLEADEATPPSSQAWPAPTCAKPDPGPLRDRPGNDAAAVTAYNAKVRHFNRMSADFNACTKAYIDGVNHEIDRLRSTGQDRLTAIAGHANARIRIIALEVNAAIAAVAGNSAPAIEEPDAEFPPTTCERPAKAARYGKLNRVSAKAADRYDDQQRGFDACIVAYIDKGKAELDHIRQAADSEQKETADETNRRITLLNRLAALAAEGATETARQVAAQTGVVSTDSSPDVTAIDRSAAIPP